MKHQHIVFNQSFAAAAPRAFAAAAPRAFAAAAPRAFIAAASRAFAAAALTAFAVIVPAACDLPNTPPQPNVAAFHEAESPFFTAAPSRVAGMAASKDVFVTVAVNQNNKGEIAASEDGITWQKLQDPETGNDFFDISFTAITYGGGLTEDEHYFFAGGEDSKAAFSKDGKNWSVGVITPMSPKTINAVAAGHIHGLSVFVVVGDDGRICYSVGGPQGEWYPAKLTPFGQVDNYGEAITAVCFGVVNDDGVFVAVGKGGKYAFANDLSGRWYGGRTGSSKDFTAVGFGNEKFLAVGDAGVVKFISKPDEYRWTEADSRGFHSYPLRAVIFNEALKIFVVLGDNAAIGYSRFGDIWYTGSFSEDGRFPDGITAGAHNGKRLILGGPNGEIAYSN